MCEKNHSLIMVGFITRNCKHISSCPDHLVKGLVAFYTGDKEWGGSYSMMIRRGDESLITQPRIKRKFFLKNDDVIGVRINMKQKKCEWFLNDVNLGAEAIIPPSET
eukprot:UN16957